MRLEAATELNYQWKVNAVGGSYRDPEPALLKDPPPTEIPFFTILTAKGDIRSRWEEGELSL